jgi:hypothetical protein
MMIQNGHVPDNDDRQTKQNLHARAIEHRQEAKAATLGSVRKKTSALRDKT